MEFEGSMNESKQLLPSAVKYMLFYTFIIHDGPALPGPMTSFISQVICNEPPGAMFVQSLRPST